MSRICILVPTLSGGGAEKVAVNLANHYCHNAHQVDLVLFRESGPYLSSVSRLVNVVDLKIVRTRFALLPIIKHFSSAKYDYIFSCIRDSNIILGVGAYFFRANKTCVVFREANTMNNILRGPFPTRKVMIHLMRLAYRNANLVIANSEDTKRDLLLNHIVSEGKLSVIQNPVIPEDVGHLSNLKVDEPWLYDQNLKVVLGVGRLHYQKNFNMLINSFSLLYKERQDVRLIIIGEGEDKLSLEARLRSLGLSNVAKFISFQSNVYPYYKNSDIFVLTSRWEGFGNVLVESMSVGATIISSNCPGGPKSILDNGKYGALVDEYSPEAFANAISSALIDDERRTKERKSYLIERSKIYSIDFVSDEYLKAASRRMP